MKRILSAVLRRVTGVQLARALDVHPSTVRRWKTRLPAEREEQIRAFSESLPKAARPRSSGRVASEYGVSERTAKQWVKKGTVPKQYRDRSHTTKREKFGTQNTITYGDSVVMSFPQRPELDHSLVRLATDRTPLGPGNGAMFQVLAKVIVSPRALLKRSNINIQKKFYPLSLEYTLKRQRGEAADDIRKLVGSQADTAEGAYQNWLDAYSEALGPMRLLSVTLIRRYSKR